MQRFAPARIPPGRTVRAPGTGASFVAAVIYYVVWLLLGTPTPWVMALLTVAFAAATVAITPWATVHFGRPDPRQLVLDEAVGQWIALMFIPFGPNPAKALSLAVGVFFLFRGFDIVKPFPIRRIERLPGGWGILLDDVAAGILAGIAFRLLMLLPLLLKV